MLARSAFDQHHGVGAVARGDPHLSAGDNDSDGDGPWRVECRHDSSPLIWYLICCWAAQPTRHARLLNVASAHRYPTRAIPAHQARAAAA
jgi:hypothetical protein